jgi:RNA polymerase sigma factor (sigma-70 family)
MSRTAGPLAPVVRLLHKIAADPAADDTDVHLLERFTQARDEAAFEGLLRRHGAMVLGVCRRVLDDADLADDAFQATFLVLARKADSIRKRPSVGSWLFGVAFRTSLKARARAVRRRIHERAIMQPATTEPSEEFVWRELRPLLDAELDRLPEKYRAPLVLCYLEGKTNEEAARQLGWTKGTVSGRLARARDVLRQRLVRRGLDLTAGALAAALAQSTATAAVPEPLFRATLLGAAGHTAATGAVASLSEGVIHMMTLNKVRTTALVLLVAVGLGAAGVGWTYQPGVSGDQKQPPVTVVRPDSLQGTWQLVALSVKGKKPPPEEIKSMRWMITRDTLAIVVGDEKVEARYKTDPTQKPAALDLTIVKGPENERNKSYKAIYRLQDDELRVCMAEDGNRPAEFAAGEKAILFTFKRADKVKPDKRAQPPAAPKTWEEQRRLVEIERAKAVMAEATARVRVLKERLKQAQDQLEQAEAQLRVAEAQLRRLKDDASPDAAPRRQSAENLKKIGIAFHNYHDTLTTLPARAIYGKDGKPLLSWRVALLPYLDQQELYQQFKLDEPWDSEHNKKLLDRMPEVFRSPAAQTKAPATPYQVFTGQGAPFHEDKGLRLTQFADGTSNTILVVEAGRAVPWTRPDDLAFDVRALPKLGGVVKDGFHALMADGAVRFFPNGTDQQVLRAAITYAGGELFSWDKEGRPALKR